MREAAPARPRPYAPSADPYADPYASESVGVARAAARRRATYASESCASAADGGSDGGGGRVAVDHDGAQAGGGGGDAKRQSDQAAAVDRQIAVVDGGIVCHRPNIAPALAHVQRQRILKYAQTVIAQSAGDV